MRNCGIRLHEPARDQRLDRPTPGVSDPGDVTARVGAKIIRHGDERAAVGKPAPCVPDPADAMSESDDSAWPGRAR